MTNQEQNNLNAYEQFKQRFAKYSPYLVALRNFQEKDDIKGLKKLAIENAPEEPEKLRVSKSSDVKVISNFFEVGLNRTERDFEEFGNTNLKEILEKTPKKNLEAVLASVELKDEFDGTSNSALKTHKAYQQMYKNLAVFSDKESEEEDREKALDKMKNKVTEFYKSKYKKDKDLLDALKYLSEVDVEINVLRYSMFTQEKREELEKKVGTDLGPYLRDSVKDKLALYAMIATDFKKRK